MTIVETAIEKAGGPSALAKVCGLHHSSVIFWRKLGHIPAKNVLAVESATGIPREELRPDLFRPQASHERGAA